MITRGFIKQCIATSPYQSPSQHLQLSDTPPLDPVRCSCAAAGSWVHTAFAHSYCTSHGPSAVHPQYTDPRRRTSSVHVAHSSEYGSMPRAVHPQYAYSLYSGSMLRFHLVSYSSSSTSAWLLPVSAITSSRFRKGACRKGGRGWGEGGRGGQHQQPGLTASAWGSRSHILSLPPARIAVQPGLSFFLLPCPYFPLTLPPPLYHPYGYMINPSPPSSHLVHAPPL